MVVTSSEECDAVVDEFLTGPATGVLAESLAQVFSRQRSPLPSGFPSHELLVGVDRERRVGLLRFMDEGGSFVTLGAGDPESVVDYYLMGHHTEFPGNSEVPIEVIRLGLKQFLHSGGQRPTCAQWQPD
jgi:hypothetical protein